MYFRAVSIWLRISVYWFVVSICWTWLKIFNVYRKFDLEQSFYQKQQDKVWVHSTFLRHTSVITLGCCCIENLNLQNCKNLGLFFPKLYINFRCYFVTCISYGINWLWMNCLLLIRTMRTSSGLNTGLDCLTFN